MPPGAWLALSANFLDQAPDAGRFGVVCKVTSRNGSVETVERRAFDFDLTSGRYQNKGTGVVKPLQSYDENQLTMSRNFERNSTDVETLNRVTGEYLLKLWGYGADILVKGNCEKVPYQGMEVQKKF